HSFNFINTTKFGGGSLNYIWTLGDASTSSDSNVLNKTYSKDSNYSVKLATTTSVGCNASKTKMVYLGTYPDVKISVNRDTQCFKGHAFNFSNQSSIKKGSISGYVWNFGNNDTSHKVSINNYRYSTEDTFMVTVIATSQLGCRDTASIRVVTFAQGKSQFSVNNAMQCKDQNGFAFTNASAVKYGNLSYQWRFGDNTVSAATNPFKTYNNPGVYQVGLITTTNHNCKDTTLVPVTVYASPLAAFNINNDKQCFRGNRFVFSSSSTISQGSISRFDWQTGDNHIDSGANISRQYLSEDSFNVRLIVTSNNACKDTIQKAVVVHPQPKAAFKVNNDVQCFKQQKFVLTNNSSIKSGALTYSWNFGDATASTDTNVTKTYLKDSVYNVRLITSSALNCKDTAFRTLTLYPSPNARFIIDKDTQCFRGNVFNFTNQSNTVRSTITSYEWDMDDGKTFFTPGVSNYSFLFEDTFNVSLVITNNRSCTDTMIKPAVTFAQPMVSFTVPNDSQCWQKNFFVINNQTKLKYGTLKNSWNFGDNTTSDEFTPSTKKYPNTSASYIIKYKAVSEHGCSDSASHRIVLLERPISDFTINDSIQCFRGHQFSFTNTTNFSAMNTLSYWWDYGNGNKHTGFAPQTATYNNPDKYPVQLVAYSSLTNCYDTAIKIVIPAPHATVNFAMNNDSQCFRYNRFVMDNTSDVQFGTMKYNWRFGDNTSDTAKQPIKSYATEGAYTIKLVVTTNYDCADSLS
ncbi:MAG: PKD domain-containing protein, partial [Bacteroidetes bacterium]|nr:PKD domain-containing protein [Bacteroidota bacterium]